MSELFDKQVNVQKENLKKSWELTQDPTRPQRVCDENERNDTHVKMLLMEGSTL